MPPVVLERGSRTPLAVQLADGLRAAAAGGTLRPGDRLPSTRTLAVQLGVSRTVTSAAYEQLLAEGWVHGRTGAGTFVTAAPAAPVVTAAPAAPVVPVAPSPDAPAGPDGVRDQRIGPERGQIRPGSGPIRRSPSAPGPAALSLAVGTPCLDVLDRAAWRRAWRAAADPEPDTEPVPAGLAPFRAAVAEHLLRHRGLVIGPDDLLATAGSSAAVAELARVLPPGARVAVEEPGYVRAVTALRAAGCEVVGVPVDDGGMVVEAIPPGCAAVYCTPAHQFPLGTRLTAARRVALVERARAEGMLVVEDDYDGELRYDVAPLPLLAALAPEVVVHLGTASKILSQTVGAGWLVAPACVRDALLDLRARTGTRPSPAGQRVFTAFAAHGDLARHLRRLRRELAVRRDLVRAAVLPTGWSVAGEAAGAHVVLFPPPRSGGDAEGSATTAAAAGTADAADPASTPSSTMGTADTVGTAGMAGVAERAAAEALAGGVRVTHLAEYAHSGARPGPGLVVGYAGGTRSELVLAVTRLARGLTAAR